MGSAAKSIPSASPPKREIRVKLTMPGDPPRQKPSGPWSQGPVYQRLDSDFLQRPLIPKAPPTPRLRIDHIDGAVRVVDSAGNPKTAGNDKSKGDAASPIKVQLLDISDMPDTVSLPQLALARPGSPRVVLSKSSFPIWAIGVGFVAGLLAALLFGWF